MRKKFGFKDYIRKSFPLPTPILSYTPLTKRTLTDLTQIKKGMKLVGYLGLYGDLLKIRRGTPIIFTVTEDYRTAFLQQSGNPFVKVKDSENHVWYVAKSEIFFYEEEKALGKVE